MRSRPLSLLFVLVVALSAACGGPGARSPRLSGVLPDRLREAFRSEGSGDLTKAAELYADVIRLAAAAPEDPYALPVTLAALDALVHRDVFAFGEVASSSALVDRVSADTRKKIDDALAKTDDDAAGPFARGLVANARLALAERRGDATSAGKLRAATGCVREASIAGPTSYFPVTATDEASPFDRVGAPLPADVAGPGPFAPRVKLTPTPMTPARGTSTSTTTSRRPETVVVA